MEHPYIINGVPNEVLTDSIKSWPEGSVGEYNEKQVIIILNALCKEHGYGRITQIVNAIEDIWRYPDKAEFYKMQSEEHLNLLKPSRHERSKNNK